MRTWARSHRGLRSLLAVVLLAALAWPVVPAVAQVVPPPFTQANGCIDIIGTWSTRNVPITGTLAPTSVPVGTAATLSGTTVTQPIDLTQARPGLRSAATFAEVGTVDPADPTGPLLGQNDAATTATVALTGGGSTEGIRLVTGTGSQTFWSVSDGVTTLYFVGLPNPPTNTNLVPVTELDILVTLADTTWTAAGGSNLTVAEQSVAPSDLVVPSAADVASAPAALHHHHEPTDHVARRCQRHLLAGHDDDGPRADGRRRPRGVHPVRHRVGARRARRPHLPRHRRHRDRRRQHHRRRPGPLHRPGRHAGPVDGHDHRRRHWAGRPRWTR